MVYRASNAAVDGIRAYSEQLVGALGSTDSREAHLITSVGRGPWVPAEIADAVIVQYNPFSYGRWGFAPWLPLELRRLRSAPTRPCVALMVHEAHVPRRGIHGAVLGSWQRGQLKALLASSDLAFGATEELTRQLEAVGSVGPVHHLPVGSNLPDARSERERERRRLDVTRGGLVLAAFGTGHPSHLTERLTSTVNAVAQLGMPVTFLNLGAGAPPATAVNPAVRIVEPGMLPAERVAALLAASDIFLAPLIDGVSTRRTTLMAALQHGLPVVATASPQTDRILVDAPHALRLVPTGDSRAYVKAVCDLALDTRTRRALGSSARELYERCFDWPVIRSRLLRCLADARHGPD